LRVLICVPCLLVGGTETHTLLLAKALRDGGHAVAVCAYFEHDPMTLAEFERHRIDVILLSLSRGGRGKAMLGTPALIGALIGVLRAVRPDVVHVQYMTPGLAPLLAARLAGVPRVVATVHVTANHYGPRRWLPRSMAASFCDVFLSVSHTAERSFFGRSPADFSASLYRAGRRHFTIHNCVDLDPADRALAEPAPDSLRQSLGIGTRNVVGIVGRLDRHKGHDLLLRAMQTVLGRLPDVALLCVGAGSERTNLERECVRLGIDDRVIFAGAVPPADVFRHMRLMDVVAMPSRVGLEGFGLAAAEAMAMRRPLVASSADALAEIVGPNGVAAHMFPPGDVPTLAAKVEYLLRDPAERTRIGDAARKHVEAHFAFDRFADRHLVLYRALSGRRATPRMGAPRTAGATP
jgi:glycosyltransferase involved in cell wall biosynthesis